MRAAKVAFLVLAMTVLAACGKNPLLGKWESEPIKVFGVQTPTEILEFTKDSFKSGGKVVKVGYEVGEGRVTVFTEGTGEGQEFAIIDDDTIAVPMPLIGQLKYYRVK